jgi:hypothetical protein
MRLVNIYLKIILQLRLIFPEIWSIERYYPRILDVRALTEISHQQLFVTAMLVLRRHVLMYDLRIHLRHVLLLLSHKKLLVYLHHHYLLHLLRRHLRLHKLGLPWHLLIMLKISHHLRLHLLLLAIWLH